MRAFALAAAACLTVGQAEAAIVTYTAVARYEYSISHAWYFESGTNNRIGDGKIKVVMPNVPDFSVSMEVITDNIVPGVWYSSPAEYGLPVGTVLKSFNGSEPPWGVAHIQFDIKFDEDLSISLWGFWEHGYNTLGVDAILQGGSFGVTAELISPDYNLLTDWHGYPAVDAVYFRTDYFTFPDNSWETVSYTHLTLPTNSVW